MVLSRLQVPGSVEKRSEHRSSVIYVSVVVLLRSELTQDTSKISTPDPSLQPTSEDEGMRCHPERSHLLIYRGKQRIVT